MKIIWTRSAIDDLVEIREFISQENPAAAEGIALRILEIVDILKATPEAGKKGRISGTREIVVTKTPFIIPYRIKKRRVEILRVLHGRKMWPEHL